MVGVREGGSVCGLVGVVGCSQFALCCGAVQCCFDLLGATQRRVDLLGRAGCWDEVGMIANFARSSSARGPCPASSPSLVLRAVQRGTR